MTFTRRTHLVRVPMDDPPSKSGGQPSEYIDLEVLDAISFRIENNDEVVLVMDVKKSVPYIVDDTGGGHERKTADATQRSHMQRITKGDQKIDVEMVDCWAARDQNGDQWILDMQDASVFDISDNTGKDATRRAHDEVISVPFGKKKSEAGASYLTCQRSDNIAFEKENGDEVIISIPSCDDPNSPNVHFGRASTFTTPQNYDPADESDKAVVPPLLAESGDPHVYVSRVKGSAGFLTKDEKIHMGPFWWIRKVHTGGDLLVISFGGLANASPDWLDDVRLNTPDGKSYPLFTDINSIGTGNSALLKSVGQIFTADSPYTLDRTVRFFSSSYAEHSEFQTVFINLAGMPGNKDGEKVFSISAPPISRKILKEEVLVAWGDIFSGRPTDFTFDVYGVAVYDRESAIRYLVDTAQLNLVNGELFLSEAEAAAYIALHGGGLAYTLYPMIGTVQVLGAGISANVQTFSKKSIGGPADQSNMNGPDVLPGEYTFPLYVPKLIVADPPGPPDHDESFLYSDLDWCIGFTDATFNPWPRAQWSPIRLDVAYDPNVTTTPEQTITFRVLPASGKDRPSGVVQIP